MKQLLPRTRHNEDNFLNKETFYFYRLNHTFQRIESSIKPSLKPQCQGCQSIACKECKLLEPLPDMNEMIEWSTANDKKWGSLSCD